MVEDIYNMKNEILKQAKKELEERGPERIDVNRMGEMVDMVKDLAEAEKSCWEAQYYRRVTEAMEGSSGYTQTTNSNPASGGGNMSRQGYGTRSMRQGYDSMGSMGHGDLIEKLSEEYRQLGPEERMMYKNRIFTELGK